MQIEAKLYGTLRRHRPESVPGAPHHSFAVALPTGATVEALLAQLGIPDGQINAAAVNDEAVELSVVLADGDRVSLFPPSAGGWHAGSLPS
jgi:molybdopterin converting factor small subunit